MVRKVSFNPFIKLLILLFIICVHELAAFKTTTTTTTTGSFTKPKSITPPLSSTLFQSLCILTRGIFAAAAVAPICLITSTHLYDYWNNCVSIMISCYVCGRLQQPNQLHMHAYVHIRIMVVQCCVNFLSPPPYSVIRQFICQPSSPCN